MAQTNRRDRLQSHQFLLQRMVSAFVTHDTDPVRSPFRRGGTAVFVGVMVAVVVMAGWGVYGVLRPGGSTSWMVEDALVVEKETGAAFVYRDSTLHPVVNFASARLLAETGSPVRPASAASLASAPRGGLIGIPGAPTSLPAPGRMLGGAWSLCSRPAVDDGVVTSAATVMMVGDVPASGATPDGAGVLVRTPGGGTALVWRGRRHVLTAQAAEALALSSRPAVVVSDTWLETMPRGEDIAGVPVAGAGEPSAALDGALVGQVLRVRSMARTEELYLVRPNDLLPVTPLQAAVVLGSSTTLPAYPGGVPGLVDRGPGQVAFAPRAAPQPVTAELAAPAVMPRLVDADPSRATCMVVKDASRPATLRVDVDEVPTGVSPLGAGSGTTSADGVVDEVVVAPGRAALVEAPTSAEFGAGALSLVTDTGVRYGIPDVEAVSRLGYSSAELVTMPSALVDRLPAGPVLDRARAAQPAGL